MAIMPRPWDTSDPELNRIFCAALTGIISSPDFHSGLYQQSPRAAVDFADSVVMASMSDPEGQADGPQ